LPAKNWRGGQALALWHNARPFFWKRGEIPMSLISVAQAQSAGGAPVGAGGMSQVLILLVFVVVFYFLLIRPQQKRAKDHQAMLSRLEAGNEVVTAGGILGRIVEIEDSFITVEIAPNVRIKVQKGQITQLVPKGTYKGA
jgi:preprotein translocase subunit YajC